VNTAYDGDERAMKNSHTAEMIVPRLSVWAKQLMLEWREDVIVSPDLSRAAKNAGWRSPADEIVMSIGLIAELYAHGLAGNEANSHSDDELDLDFKDICEGLTAGKPVKIGESEYLYPFPSSGVLVYIYGTTLGVRASEILDPDLHLAKLRGRKVWIDSLPANRADEGNLAAPGAVGRAVMEIGRGSPFSPHQFFQAANLLGYEDHRDQAVVGFGTLAHLLVTGAIRAGVLDGNTFVPDGRGIADIYRDLSRWWFEESRELRFTKQIQYAPPRSLPMTPKNTAFALIHN
jgi:hypothetical protein